MARPYGLVFALLVAALVVSSVLSLPRAASAVPGPREIEMPPGFSGGSAAPRGTSFEETFETYDLGWLPPQGGWTSSYDPIFTVVADGIHGRSVRHVADGFGPFVFDTLFSPVLQPSFGPLAVTIARSDGAGVHQLVPVDLTAEIVLTRLEIEASGRVTVAQPQPGGTVFVDTGVRWTADVPLRLGISTDETGTLRVFADGAVVFVGQDLVHSVLGRPGQIDLFAVIANNEVVGTSLTIDDVGGDPARGPAGSPAVEVPTTERAGLLVLMLLLGAVGVKRFEAARDTKLSS